MRRKKDVTIKELAKSAGVSIATISRIINRKGGYSEETEYKVLELIEEKGYKVNFNAKSLKTRKTQTIGVVVPDISNEFFAKIIQSIESQAIKYNYSVFICNTDENPEMEERQLDSLEGRFVEGIICIGGEIPEKKEYHLRRTPIIYIDRYSTDREVHIESDNYHGGYIAAKELIDSGCRRIAIIKDARKVSSAYNRYQGYLQALIDNDLELNEKLICNAKVISHEEARLCTLNLLDSGEIFDGIFATNDTMAIGAMRALSERRIKVPKEVKIVGFDNTTASEIATIPLTTVNQNKSKMGELAVELLMDKILKRTTEFKNIKIPVNLIRRKSTEF